MTRRSKHTQPDQKPNVEKPPYPPASVLPGATVEVPDKEALTEVAEQIRNDYIKASPYMQMPGGQHLYSFTTLATATTGTYSVNWTNLDIYSAGEINGREIGYYILGHLRGANSETPAGKRIGYHVDVTEAQFAGCVSILLKYGCSLTAVQRPVTKLHTISVYIAEPEDTDVA